MELQLNANVDRLNELSEKIIGAAFEVSNILGTGFLEKVYYKNKLVGDYIADILVEDEILVELKTVKEFDEIHLAQCLNYLRITGLKLCLLINFGKPKVEIKRIVNGI